MHLFFSNSFSPSGTDSFSQKLEFNFKVLLSGNSLIKVTFGKYPLSKFKGVILILCSSILSFPSKYILTFVLSLIILASSKFFKEDFWLSSICTIGVSIKVW